MIVVLFKRTMSEFGGKSFELVRVNYLLLLLRSKSNYLVWLSLANWN